MEISSTVCQGMVTWNGIFTIDKMVGVVIQGQSGRPRNRVEAACKDFAKVN